MGTLKEWIGVLFYAAIWSLSMQLCFYAFSFLPGNQQFKSIRKQRILLRVHPLAFILWGLAGADFGLTFIFGSRALHGGVLIILAMVNAGVIVTILLSSRLAPPKLN